LEIIYFKEISSTQNYLLENLKENLCIWSDYQTNGIGSRGNTWIGEKGNLFFSFSINRSKLPNDLLPQSISIYFMYQMKMVLKNLNSKIQFKWPNDLYLKNKVGGIITSIKNDIIISGIGINTKKSEEYQHLDIEIDNLELLEIYLNQVLTFPKWEFVFKIYKKDFYKYNFIPNSSLNGDGSININQKRIYSLR